MKARIFCPVLLAVITLGICNAAPLNSNEHEARAFAQRASSKMFEHTNFLIQEVFATKKEDPKDILRSFETILKTAENAIQIVNESKQFDDSKFTDPELKHVFKIIRKSAEESILGKEKFFEMFFSMGVLEDLATDKDIPAFRNKSIELAFYPDIQNIFAKSNDPEELKYYWTTWREKNGEWAIGNFVNLVNLLKKAATLTDISPLEFWLRDYNVTEMERVMVQIQPLYLQLYGFIRNQLHPKYGDLVIKANGPIPHHLFEQKI